MDFSGITFYRGHKLQTFYVLFRWSVFFFLFFLFYCHFPKKEWGTYILHWQHLHFFSSPNFLILYDFLYWVLQNSSFLRVHLIWGEGGFGEKEFWFKRTAWSTCQMVVVHLHMRSLTSECGHFYQNNLWYPAHHLVRWWRRLMRWWLCSFPANSSLFSPIFYCFLLSCHTNSKAFNYRTVRNS